MPSLKKISTLLLLSLSLGYIAGAATAPRHATPKQCITSSCA